MKYTVVFEQTDGNFSAYVPDLPGCVATGDTRAEVEERIREAIKFHLDGIRSSKDPVPEPKAWSELVEAG